MEAGEGRGLPSVRLTVSEGGEEGGEELVLNDHLLQEFEK